MICYRDMAFCAEGDQCPARVGCDRYFSPEERVSAMKWWGNASVPVAKQTMADTCQRRKEWS